MDRRDEDSGTFMIKARRCKRCGGILTSKEAVADGYGHVCKMKMLGERAKQPITGQIGLFEEDQSNET